MRNPCVRIDRSAGGGRVDPAHTLDRAHVIRVLSPEVAGVFGLDLAVGLFLGFGFFESLDLGFGQHGVFGVLSHLGFEGFEVFLECLKIMPKPHASYPAR